MKNKIIFLLILIISCYFTSIFGQNKNRTQPRSYVSYNYFQKNYTEKDSINFIIKDGDTLIEVAELIKLKGVSVPYEPKDSIFLELYKKIAFRTKKNNSLESHSMKYWKDGIRIFFTESVSLEVKREFLSFTKLISEDIDSLTITSVKSSKNANFIIYHNTDFNFEDNLKNTLHANYYVHWNNKSQINKGFIKINKENLFSDYLEITELKQLFVYSLGWFNTSDDLDCSSYFNDCITDKKELNDLDINLIKYHYSYGICKGTTKGVFEEQHELAKKTIQNSGSTFNFYHEE